MSNSPIESWTRDTHPSGSWRIVPSTSASSFRIRSVEDLETPTHAAFVTWRVTKQNVDQQLIALLQTYWFNTVNPNWIVRQWQVDVTMPNEVAYGDANEFSVEQVVTDFYTAQFDLVAEGVSLNKIMPIRRYTASMGFPNMPRAGR